MRSLTIVAATLMAGCGFTAEPEKGAELAADAGFAGAGGEGGEGGGVARDAGAADDAAPAPDLDQGNEPPPPADAGVMLDMAPPEPDATERPDAAPDAGPELDLGPDADPELDLGPDMAVPPEDPLSDEFEGEADLLAGDETGWRVLHEGRAHSITIAEGALTVVANNPPPGENWGWFTDHYGPLVYKEVGGDFAVSTRLRVTDDADLDRAPTGDFNAGGFVVRDPAGTHGGDENWVMYNVGAQGRTGYAREIKKTVDSDSGLYLNPQPFSETALLLCRVGAEIRFWRWADDAWVAERFEPGVTENHARGWPEVDESGVEPMRFEHPGLPEVLQVGVMAHVWTPAGPDDESRTRATVDYVRFAAEPPSEFADCPAAFPAP